MFRLPFTGARIRSGQVVGDRGYSGSSHRAFRLPRKGVLRHLPPIDLSLLTRFSVISFVLIAILAVALAWGIQNQLEQSALHQVADSAISQVADILGPQFRSTDFQAPLAPDRYAKINDLVHQLILRDHIVRVKVWSADGLLVYSDQKDLVGRRFPVEDDLTEAMDGEEVMGISTLNAAENVDERLQFDRLLEIYVPLRISASSKPAAVYEIYHDVVDLDRRNNEMRTFIWSALGLGFLALYGSLFTLVRGASHDLTRQSKDNAKLYEEATQRLAERKQAEETLRRSELYFRALTEHGTDIISVVNSDGTIRYESPSMYRVLGHRPEDLIGASTFQFIHPDDRPTVLDSFQRLHGKTNGTPVEFRFRHKDGSWRVLEAVGRNLLKDPDLNGIVINSRDVTERKNAEDAVRQSEQRFRNVFEGAAIGVALSDVKGHIIESNQAFQEMLGYTGDELRELTIVQMTHPEDVAANWNFFTELIELKRQHYEMVKRYFRKDGAIVWVNLTVSLIRDANGDPEFVMALVENITDKRHAQEQIQRHLERLAALRSIDIAITSSMDLLVTLDIFLDKVTTQLEVDAAHILLFNQHNQMLEHAASQGFRTTAITASAVRLGDGYAGLAALERRTLHIPDLSKLESHSRAALLMGESFRECYVVPLVAKGQVKGVLEIFHRDFLNPDQEWLNFMEALAGQAAIAIDSATMFTDLQRSNVELALAYDTTLEGWSRALDLRDEETEGHTRRVTETTVRLARAMGVSDADLLQIRRGALLHDMGKMGIPDSILLKPGPLTDEEWEIMRKHPDYAYKLLAPISFLHPALDIPYCHHEKWDGSGYPRGLKGEQIPQAARIFAIVDVWDALRSDRPYRSAWPEERVREHLRSQAGTHFDPQIVEAFFHLDF